MIESIFSPFLVTHEAVPIRYFPNPPGNGSTHKPLGLNDAWSDFAQPL
jgi:hypothetical protein